MNKRILSFSENFWIVIIWSIIFVFILTWDQEKIVVLNLILFSYFLYYIASDTIFTTLNSRKQVLLDSVLADINLHRLSLTEILKDIDASISAYSKVLLTVLKKTLVRFYLQSISSAAAKIAPSLVFYEVQLYFSFLGQYSALRSLQYNLFVSSSSVYGVLPALSSDTDL